MARNDWEEHHSSSFTFSWEELPAVCWKSAGHPRGTPLWLTFAARGRWLSWVQGRQKGPSPAWLWRSLWGGFALASDLISPCPSPPQPVLLWPSPSPKLSLHWPGVGWSLRWPCSQHTSARIRNGHWWLVSTCVGVIHGVAGCTKWQVNTGTQKCLILIRTSAFHAHNAI